MSDEITNDQLIDKARALIRPKRIGPYLIADVGCALISDQNHLYLGVCIDSPSSMGFCAESSAIAAMVTAGEYKIRKIVAVLTDGRGTFVGAPCGKCREFMRAIDSDNLKADVILGSHKVVKLGDLLPCHDWYAPIEH
jgi:cytidine deaminase